MSCATSCMFGRRLSREPVGAAELAVDPVECRPPSKPCPAAMLQHAYIRVHVGKMVKENPQIGIATPDGLVEVL